VASLRVAATATASKVPAGVVIVVAAATDS
jgi:hypothetical protein